LSTGGTGWSWVRFVWPVWRMMGVAAPCCAPVMDSRMYSMSAFSTSTCSKVVKIKSG